MEQLDYTAPVQTTNLRVASLHLNWESAQIRAVFRTNTGILVEAIWSGAPATQLMIALNKANLSTNSLHRRVINQALNDGKLPDGTLSGSPD